MKIQMKIRRKKTRSIRVGNITIGGNAPVSVQSMAKVEPANVAATVRQIRCLEEAGCEIVRVAVPDMEAAWAIRDIRKKIRIPLVADIHFNYQLAIHAIRAGADKIRLNPGNIKNPHHIRKVVELAKERRVPIRIGVNAGSLQFAQERHRDPADRVSKETAAGRTISHLMAKSALGYVRMFEGMGFYDTVISLKASNVIDCIEAYRTISKACDYPLHIGVTAAGLPQDAVIKSSIGIGALLLEGIGDTIRVSLAGDPVMEVKVAQSILQSLGIRSFKPEMIVCPACGRCGIDVARLAKEVEAKLEDADFFPQNHHKLKIAVMGCVVNGPGEARDADVGIAGSGDGWGLLFAKGKKVRKVKEKDIVSELIEEITHTKESRLCTGQKR
jgi:(E)-4-hydroxy-3-methylbut-2-enyl-diphosphate synthase